MKILLYAESGAERQLLLNALEGVGLEPEHPVDLWEQLLAQIAVNRPDVAILSYATLAASGDDTVHTAGLTLRAIGVPVIVSLDAVYAAAADDIAQATGFSNQVTTPFDEEDLAAAVTRATGREIFVRRSTDVTSDFAAVADDYTDAGVYLSESGNHVVATEADDADADAPAPPAPESSPESTETNATTDTEAFFGARLQAAPRPPPIDDGSATEEIQIVDDPFADFDDDDDDVDPFAEALAWSGSHREAADSGSPRRVSDGSSEQPAAASDAAAAKEASTGESSGAYRQIRRAPSGESRRVFVSAPSGEATAYGDDSASASAATGDDSSAGATERDEPSYGDEPAVVPESGASARVGSEPTPAPTEAGEAEVSLELPPNAGSLDDVDVAGVLHGLCVRRATGELVLQHDSLTRRVVVFDGNLGTVFQPPTAEDERKLLSTVGWKGGVFDFVEQDVPEAQFHSFGEGLELLYRGVERHIGINELAVALQSDLRRYPLRTNQVDRLSRVLGLEDIQTFAESSDGTATLEQRLASAGPDTEKVLRHAYFARMTGAIVFHDQPRTGVVRLRFEEPAREVTERPRIRATASAPPLLGGDASRAPKVDVPEAVKARQRAGDPIAESGSHRATFDRLGQLWTQISSQDPYEVFELEPGCGADAVNKRFYELVREYHPDRYARVQSAQIKNLAEKIFLHVRSLHTDLVEREQTGNFRRSSTGGFQRGRSGVRPSVPDASDSGLTARERRAKRRSAASRLAASQSGPQTSVRASTSTRRARTAESGGQEAPRPATGQPQAVGESINRLRSRAGSGNSGSVPTATGTHGAVGGDAGFTRGTTGSYSTIANSRRLAPDQLMRNAKKAIENGAEDKAWDLLELAKVKGLKGYEVDAYEVYLLSRRGELADDAASKRLEEIYENTEAHRLERSQAAMLLGHLKRIDEAWAASSKWYDRSMEQDPDNQETIRWLRFVKKRAEGDEGKKSGSFLDRLRAALNKKL